MTVMFTSNTYFSVGTLAAGSRIPVSNTFSVTQAGAVGDASLTVAALPGYLSAGRKLTVGGQTITVGADTLRGATVLPLAAPLTGTVAANSTTNYFELLPFIGGEGVDINGQDQVISIRNFRSGQWNENVKVMTGLSMDLQGQFHKEDLALTAIIRPAYFFLGKEIYAEILRDNGDRWYGAFLVSGYSETGALDNVVRVKFTLASQGGVGIPAPGSLSTLAI